MKTTTASCPSLTIPLSRGVLLYSFIIIYNNTNVINITPLKTQNLTSAPTY